jgi:hypothetical protein
MISAIRLILKTSPYRLRGSFLISVSATIILGLGASLFQGVRHDIETGLNSLVRGDRELTQKTPFSQDHIDRLTKRPDIT